MALTSVQKEQLKKALFYVTQDPKTTADILEELFGGGSEGTQMKQMELIADASTDTGADLKAKLNEILAGLKTAGIMKTE